MDDMSKKRENDQESPGMLLGPQERLICEQLVAGQPPYSQRAQSLLAIDAGATQKTAALQSGQSVGQVSYWLSNFRKDRMSIFPEEILLQIEPEPPSSQQLTGTLTPSESPEIDQRVEPDAIKEDSKSAEPEAKLEKKAKKKKKSKKVKGSKKSKKGKKSAKKKQAKKSKKRKKNPDKKK